LKLVSGSVVAQILAIILIPIITRLYTPEDYGTFSLILAITAIIAIFSSLSYQLAIMLPKEYEDAAQIVTLCFILIIFSSIITGVLFSSFASSIAGALNVPAMEQYLWCVPFLVFFTASYSVLAYWNSRRKLFGAYAVAQVTNSLTSKGVQIGMGMMSASPFNLILGIFFGYFCAICIMLKGFSKDLTFFKNTSFNKVKQLAIRYKKFPIYTSWSTTANELSRQVPSILLTFFFNSTIVGFYSLAYQVLMLPSALIGTATAQVFFQRASEERNNGRPIKGIVQSIHQSLIIIGFLPMIIIFIIGQDLFGLIFGANWSIAGIYAKWLIPWIFLMFISSPLTVILTILEKQELALIFDILLLVSRVISLFIGGVLGDPLLSIIIFSLTGTIFCFIMNIIILNLSGLKIIDELTHIFKSLFFGFILVIPLLFGKIFAIDSVNLVFIAIIIGIFYYYIIVKIDPAINIEFKLF